MRMLADEIALGLLKEWQTPKVDPVSPALKIRDLSVDQIAREPVIQQEDAQTRPFSERQFLLRRLQLVENALEKLASRRQCSNTWIVPERKAGSNLSS